MTSPYRRYIPIDDAWIAWCGRPVLAPKPVEKAGPPDLTAAVPAAPSRRTPQHQRRIVKRGTR